jgi:hypothetical protein
LGDARLWAVDTVLKLTTSLLPGRKISAEKTWLNPVVGLIGSIDATPETLLHGQAFVGGLGGVRAPLRLVRNPASTRNVRASGTDEQRAQTGDWNGLIAAN